MKTRRKRGFSALTRLIISLILLLVSGYLIYSGAQDLWTTAEIRSSIQENEERYKQLKAEKEELEKAKKDLTNPDYIEYMARGKYLVTKEGEQVFKFPSVKEKEEKSE